MTALRYCSLTGVDEQTNRKELFRLARTYPIAEFGVLYSEERMAKDAGVGRYPRRAWIESFIEEANERVVRTALHVCGNDATRFLKEDEALWDLSQKFGRVQVNLNVPKALEEGLTAQDIERAMHHYVFSHSYGRVILQYNDASAELIKSLRGAGHHDVVADASGGRGISPSAWPDARDFVGMRLGYAGGLGPDNIEAQMPGIAAAAGGRSFWVDMETRLRSAEGDLYDLGACEKVLSQVSQFVLRSNFEAGEDASQVAGFATQVEDLNGIGLNWWAGLAAGYLMNVPPAQAARATYMSRSRGDHTSFSPDEFASDFAAAIDDSDVGCLKQDGVWLGITREGERVSGSSRQDAMLRALIVQEFGRELPLNVGHCPTLHRYWVGPITAEELLPQLLPRAAAAVRP